jgi:hypothetical protein
MRSVIYFFGPGQRNGFGEEVRALLRNIRIVNVFISQRVEPLPPIRGLLSDRRHNRNRVGCGFSLTLALLTHELPTTNRKLRPLTASREIPHLPLVTLEG